MRHEKFYRIHYCHLHITLLSITITIHQIVRIRLSTCSADLGMTRVSSSVAESEVAFQAVTSAVRHPPGGEQKGVNAGGQESNEGEGQVSDVIMACVVLVFPNKVSNEAEDIYRAPTKSKQKYHYDHVLLSPFFFTDVYLIFSFYWLAESFECPSMIRLVASALWFDAIVRQAC